MNDPLASMTAADPVPGARVLASPVVPSPSARQSLQPISNRDVSFGEGFWAERLAANREASLIHGYEQLEKAGNFENFRIAAGLAQGEYRGWSAIGAPYMFLDSDVYKWLEAVYWELGRSRSAKLEALAGETVGLLAAAQQPDGYLNSFFQITTPGRRFHSLVVGHELYNAGHLLQAAVAEARAAGGRALLEIGCRNADCLYREFVTDGNPGLPAHPGIEMALVELYRVTGERRYLELATIFIDRRGHGRLGHGRHGSIYYQDHLPIREAREITGHAVMAVYLASGLVDTYAETGDRALLEAAQRQWDDLVATKSYITGGFGSRYRDEAIGDAYELPPDRAYCETCAAIGSIMLSWRLLLATGQARYAELIERTLYNGVLPGVSLDGRNFFYANPLHVRTGHADPADGIGAATRSPWFFCACCPPNVMRTFASLEHLVATRNEAGLQIQQFAEARLETDLAPGRIKLAMHTGYPFDGDVSIEIEAAPDAPIELSLRIPRWAGAEAGLMLNAEPVPTTADRLGYCRIRRVWRRGDRLVLTFPMTPRWTEADAHIDAVRGCVALERGPLVYCFEGCDQPEGLDLDSVSVRPGPVRGAESSGLPRWVPSLACDGKQRADPALSWPYHDAGRGPASPPVSVPLVAIPYFAWANRALGTMRIWVPAYQAG